MIFEPIAEILGAGQIDTLQAEWVNLDSPSQIGLLYCYLPCKHLTKITPTIWV